MQEIDKILLTSGTTILGGFLTFVIGQIVVRFIIDPVVSFKETLGEISYLFLSYQDKITNSHATKETIQEIKKCSGKLLSKKHAIPFYFVTRGLFGLPNEKEIFGACACLNIISYKADPILNDTDASEVNIQIKKASNLLKIPLSYRNIS